MALVRTIVENRRKERGSGREERDSDISLQAWFEKVYPA